MVQPSKMETNVCHIKETSQRIPYYQILKVVTNNLCHLKNGIDNVFEITHAKMTGQDDRSHKL